MTQREAYVRGHVAWLTGETDTHPGGMAGKRWIIDRHDGSKGCWETAPTQYRFGEYANAVDQG